jgi:hypothetical protein
MRKLLSKYKVWMLLSYAKNMFKYKKKASTSNSFMNIQGTNPQAGESQWL